MLPLNLYKFPPIAESLYSKVALLKTEGVKVRPGDEEVIPDVFGMRVSL